MAFRTAEIKWFAPRADLWMRIYERIPWLDDYGDRQPPRTDRYLHTGEDGIGIKLREGNLEVKYRTGPPKLLEVDDIAIGSMETWVKWPLNDPETQTTLAGNERWLDIRKERRMKWFGFRGFNLHPVPADTFPDEGCCIEFTKITFGNGDVHYSLGYEAFSTVGAWERNLIYALEQTLSPQTGMPDAERCMSYPGLLLEY